MRALRQRARLAGGARPLWSACRGPARGRRRRREIVRQGLARPRDVVERSRRVPDDGPARGRGPLLRAAQRRVAARPLHARSPAREAAGRGEDRRGVQRLRPRVRRAEVRLGAVSAPRLRRVLPALRETVEAFPRLRLQASLDTLEQSLRSIPATQRAHRDLLLALTTGLEEVSHERA